MTSCPRKTWSGSNAADRILAETGIEFRDDPVALDHWRRAGAEVDGLLVKFPPGLLREVLQTAPRSSPSTPAIPRTIRLRSAANPWSFAPPMAAPS
jgi:trimethylamine--corrinoid protein Co-methyltransferase